MKICPKQVKIKNTLAKILHMNLLFPLFRFQGPRKLYHFPALPHIPHWPYSPISRRFQILSLEISSSKFQLPCNNASQSFYQDVEQHLFQACQYKGSKKSHLLARCYSIRYKVVSYVHIKSVAFPICFQFYEIEHAWFSTKNYIF